MVQEGYCKHTIRETYNLSLPTCLQIVWRFYRLLSFLVLGLFCHSKIHLEHSLFWSLWDLNLISLGGWFAIFFQPVNCESCSFRQKRQQVDNSKVFGGHPSYAQSNTSDKHPKKTIQHNSTEAIPAGPCPSGSRDRLWQLQCSAAGKGPHGPVTNLIASCYY